MSRRLGARALLLGGVFIAILAAFYGPVEDPDFWWHVRTGRWMLEHAALPGTDLYTFTATQHRWTDHEYLTEILMWLGYQHGGFIAIGVAFTLITWLGFLLLYRAAGGGSQPYVIAGLGIAAGAVAGAPIWGPRAQMITFALSCLEVMWIRAFLRGRSRALYLLPLVMILWANLHGGWVIALVFLGAAIVSEAIRWVRDRRPETAARALRLVAVSVASTAAVGLTPHGLALYLYPFATQGSAAQQRLIVEWFSPDFHQVYMRPFEGFVFLVLAGLLLRPRGAGEGRLWVHDVVLTLLALALALQSVRHIAIFIAAATPILIESWAETWTAFTAGRGWRLARSSGGGPRLAPVTLLLLLLISIAIGSRLASEAARQKRAVTEQYPVAAADWLRSHPEVGRRMYNQYGWGGYLVYRFYPDPSRRVFIFGEAALMGDSLLTDYETVEMVRPRWQEVLDRYQVDYVLFPSGSALTQLLSSRPEWHEVYSDGQASIYSRPAP